MIDGEGKKNVERYIGGVDKVVLCHETAETLNGKLKIHGTQRGTINHDQKAMAVMVTVPVEADDVRLVLSPRRLMSNHTRTVAALIVV